MRLWVAWKASVAAPRPRQTTRTQEPRQQRFARHEFHHDEPLIVVPRQAVHAGNAVAHLQHAAHLANVELAFVVFNLGLNDRGNLIRIESHVAT